MRCGESSPAVWSWRSPGLPCSAAEPEPSPGQTCGPADRCLVWYSEQSEAALPPSWTAGPSESTGTNIRRVKPTRHSLIHATKFGERKQTYSEVRGHGLRSHVGGFSRVGRRVFTRLNKQTRSWSKITIIHGWLYVSLQMQGNISVRWHEAMRERNEDLKFKSANTSEKAIHALRIVMQVTFSLQFLSTNDFLKKSPNHRLHLYFGIESGGEL